MADYIECTCTWSRYYKSEGGSTEPSTEIITKRDLECKAHKTAKVIIFKTSGKYYTEEYWIIPPNAIGPYDMIRSVSKAGRWEGWHILVESQEPWGYPHLIVGDK